MSKKKSIAILCCIIITICANVMIFKFVNLGTVEDNIPMIKIVMASDKADVYQLFYSDSDKFSEENSSSYLYSTVNENAILVYKDLDIKRKFIRLDFGEQPSNIQISDIYFQVMFDEHHLDLSMIKNNTYENDIEKVWIEEGILHIVTNGNDPHIVFETNSIDFYNDISKKLNNYSIIINIIICLIMDIAVLVCIKHISRLLYLPIELYKNRRLILNLSKNDFKTRFAGSYLGIIWAFVHPIVTVLVYWFVFEVGFRAGSVSEYPYILWLMAGLVPWFFFSEALNSATGAFIDYNYLVKKVVFKISILPMVKVISALFVHIFFVSFIIIFAWAYGYTPDIYSLQIIYYMICSFVLVLGISYLTSSLVGFFRDLTQLISIFLQVGMWMTPIMWNANIASPILQFILKINPVYYIVDGFRDSILVKEAFWNKPLWSIYFWFFMIGTFILGALAFKKLKIHFADVL